jgi:lipopolysaccharide export system permease protein
VIAIPRRAYPPLVARYLQREFLRVFAAALLFFVLIYLLADFFDRFDTVLRHDPSLRAVVETFALKLPFVVTQVAPVAVLAASLVGLGLLARHREIVALKACGISRWQMLAPLLVLGLIVSMVSLAWNETVVPAAARRWHTVWNRDIKGKKGSSVFAGREIWYRGAAGLYNFQRVRLGRRTLLGVTIYQLDDDFTPRRIITAKRAEWTGSRWRLDGVETTHIEPSGPRVTAGPPEDFALPETLDDFRVVDIEPEALSFGMLREQIRVLHAKGIDTSDSWVDLYLKLALPSASIVMILIGAPLAIRTGRGRGLGSAVGVALVVGFSYFIVVGFARALGQNGALPPLIAAWISNVLFSLVGVYLVLGAD